MLAYTVGLLNMRPVLHTSGRAGIACARSGRAHTGSRWDPTPGGYI
jgi:hypothetical protein